MVLSRLRCADDVVGLPRAGARGGLHLRHGNRICVSTGVGLERGPAPLVRLFALPSIGVLDLAG